MNPAEIVMLKCIAVLIIQRLGLLVADELERRNRPIIAYITGFINAAIIFSVKFEALLVSIMSG